MVIPLAIFFVSLCQDTTCKTGVDSLTKSTIYITSETLPENEGGLAALLRKLGTVSIDTIPEDYDLKFLVAFIVEADGSITGERVLKDKTNTVGPQMLNIIRSFKWKPGTCNHKNVRMLVKIPLLIDISDQ